MDVPLQGEPRPLPGGGGGWAPLLESCPRIAGRPYGRGPPSLAAWLRHPAWGLALADPQLHWLNLKHLMISPWALSGLVWGSLVPWHPQNRTTRLWSSSVKPRRGAHGNSQGFGFGVGVLGPGLGNAVGRASERPGLATMGGELVRAPWTDQEETCNRDLSAGA